jgi:hypothetical protein
LRQFSVAERHWPLIREGAFLDLARRAVARNADDCPEELTKAAEQEISELLAFLTQLARQADPIKPSHAEVDFRTPSPLGRHGEPQAQLKVPKRCR